MPSKSFPTSDDFIAKLPKVELHLHLEGSVRPRTLRELARRKSRLREETESWIAERERLGFRYRHFQDFLEAFKLVSLLLETPQDYALATTHLIEALAAENVRYAEITLAAGVLLWKKQPVDAVFEAVAEAAAEASGRLGVRIAWIMDAVRQFGIEPARQVIKWAARFREHGVVGFGIGGDEGKGPAEMYVDIYREARDRGLHTTAHAGETVGPHSIRAAVELLEAERIGHGITAGEDASVIALLGEREIALEICPTSNVATGVIARWADHPLPQFLQAGLAVTLNSDDPAMFDTSVQEEFRRAARQFALSDEDILRMTWDAIRVAFLPEDHKARLFEELQTVSGGVMLSE
jgi:aminodeoxyfutalosine deaminase